MQSLCDADADYSETVTSSSALNPVGSTWFIVEIADLVSSIWKVARFWRLLNRISELHVLTCQLSMHYFFVSEKKIEYEYFQYVVLLHRKVLY